MNKKEKFFNFIENNIINKKRSFVGENFVNKNIKFKRSDGETTKSENQELILKIKTNSESPIQDTFIKWKEIIDANAFDESLKNIEAEPINCYIDHDMSIEGLIASTQNGSMRVEKKDDGIYGIIPANLKEPKLMKAFEWIKNGTVKSNSFIFLPIDIEYKDEVVDGEEIFTVIHKKAKLLSIDPVIAGFYPFNDCEVVDEKTERKIGEKMNNKKEYKKLLELSKTRDLTKEELKLKNKLEKLILKSALEKDDDDDDKDEETIEAATIQTKDEEVEDPKEVEDQDFHDDEETPDGKTDEVEELKSDSESKEEVEKNDNEESEKKSETPPDIKLTKSQIVNLNFKSQTQTQINLPKKEEMKMNYNDLLKKFLRSREAQKRELAPLIKNNVDDYLNSLDAELRNEIKQSIMHTANSNIFAERIDGSNYTNGLAFISILNDPRVFTELEKILPEINGAQIINLDTLDEVKKDLLIPAATPINPIAEGADAIFVESETISIPFKPTRYSTEIRINEKLANAAETLEKETLNRRSSIVQSIRKTFYESLFKHKDVAISTLISSTGSTYSGGITKEALVPALEVGKLTFQDFDKIIDSISSTYGTDVETHFSILMHPTTYSTILAQYNSSGTPAWNLFDRTKKTYRGIKIITANEYPYILGTSSTTEPVILFVRKESIVIRGLNFVMEDNPYINQAKGLFTRFTTTRGEIKLIDPYLNTIGVTIPTTKKETLGGKAAEVLGMDPKSKLEKEINNINKQIESRSNSTKEKDIKKIEELNKEKDLLIEELKKYN